MENNIVINIPESFVVEEVARFRNETNKLIEEGKKDFILDFGQCHFIDSTGLGVIIGVYKKCVQINGRIRIKSVNAEVEKLFRLTRLDKVLEIIP